MSSLKLQIPKKLEPIWSTDKRFVVARGGRGSAKSWGFADFFVIKAYQEKKRILCTREIQNSIKDSVHTLLEQTIRKHNLESFYDITDKGIKGNNGSEFIYKGLRHHAESIKSIEGIDYGWVEEAHTAARKGLEILTPTIRKNGSQIFFSYNPTDNDDPVHVDYGEANRDDTLVIDINWRDNPWFPEVLKDELEYDKRTDYDKYLHKWEGQCVAHSEAQIFYKKWVIDDFKTPESAEWNLGLDFGFSVDPSAGIASYIIDNNLYIRYECWGLGVEIDKIPELLNGIPEIATHRAEFVADSSRPDTISYLRRNGVRITGAKKGKGSIEDGIEKIRGFEKVIIHPDCKRTIEEFRNYKWKVDPRTDEISTIPEDKNNHIIDALRYSLERYGYNRLSIIKHGGNNGINQNNKRF